MGTTSNKQNKTKQINKTSKTIETQNNPTQEKILNAQESQNTIQKNDNVPVSPHPATAVRNASITPVGINPSPIEPYTFSQKMSRIGQQSMLMPHFTSYIDGDGYLFNSQNILLDDGCNTCLAA